MVVEGEQTSPLWDALTGFQAAGPGPFSFVANIRPSTVAAFVEGLDPEPIGRSRPTPATGSSAPMPWASGPSTRPPATIEPFRDARRSGTAAT